MAHEMKSQYTLCVSYSQSITRNRQQSQLRHLILCTDTEASSPIFMCQNEILLKTLPRTPVVSNVAATVGNRCRS